MYLYDFVISIYYLLLSIILPHTCMCAFWSTRNEMHNSLFVAAHQHVDRYAVESVCVTWIYGCFLAGNVWCLQSQWHYAACCNYQLVFPKSVGSSTKGTRETRLSSNADWCSLHAPSWCSHVWKVELFASVRCEILHGLGDGACPTGKWAAAKRLHAAVWW